MTSTHNVIIKVKINQLADIDEVVQEMAYSLDHDAIVATEVMGVQE